MNEEQEINNQHIVSKIILKQYIKNKENIEHDISSLGERFIHEKHNGKSIAKKACYLVTKKDLDENDFFYVREENIIGIENQKFCGFHLYSIDPENHKNHIKQYNIQDNRSDYKIKYLLEHNFAELENKFGNFIKKLRDNYIHFNNIHNYSKDIIEFVQSNELRGKHRYESSEQTLVNTDISDYNTFKKIYSSIFIILNIEHIFDNVDNYEKFEIFNLLESSEQSENSDFKRKILAKSNNSIQNNSSQYYKLVYNNTDLSFILSDVATSKFYDNFFLYNEIINILDRKIFSTPPRKITLMPVRPDLLIIISDAPFIENHSNIDDQNIVKKINSIFYSSSNQWLVIKDILLSRSDIIDVEFHKKLTEEKIISNFVHWYENCLKNGSYSNPTFNYEKIEKYTYNIIFQIIPLLVHLEKIVKHFNIDKKIYLIVNNNLISTGTENTGFSVCKINKNFNSLIVNEKIIYNEIKKLSAKQKETLKITMIALKLISDFVLSEERQEIYFFKRTIKQKDIDN